ncbi:hypothetical protein AVEN_157905-1 [Araneus ventricosus]|uniref:Uncharacterized protein n=1 Tax=Araneus ventricosus TaxID=182803 RepID=A0A4Y2FI62_ARAVE|nr:hypothetical protein AVEN_157905-1 [Araneus ventricosus]
MSTQVLLPHINPRTVRSIATNLVFWYSKMIMHYTVRLVTAPLGGKQWSERPYQENDTRYGKKVNYKIVELLRFSTKRHLERNNAKNKTCKTSICFVAISNTLTPWLQWPGGKVLTSGPDPTEEPTCNRACCTLKCMAKCTPAGVVRKLGEGMPAQVSSPSSDRGLKLRGQSQSSPRAASKRAVNITKLKEVRHQCHRECSVK